MPKFVHPEAFILSPADDLIQVNPGLRHMSARLAQAYAERRPVSEAELQAVGAALWSALPPDSEARLQTALQAAGADILPVVVESRAAAVQSLPWETLYHPQHGFLARQPAFAFSRRFGPPRTESRPARPAPLRVLHFTALPDDLNPETERLNVEKEQERVQEALLPFVVEGKAQLEIPDDGRLETLKDLLQRFQPHVLFLSGHGRFIHQPGSGREPFGVFLFESETGAGEEVSEDELAEALQGSGLQVVVLSACESGKAASDDLNHGLARRLAALGIPHVIGMRESVLDEAGIRFADALCKALAEGERVDVALQSARAAMTALSAGPSRREAGWNVSTERLGGQWCLPMLIAPDPARPVADFSALPALTPGPSPFGRGEGMRFIGRRKELRKTKHRLLTGALKRLLITGAGGHGKTTLARKLARELEARGYAFLEWRAGTPWRNFQQSLELAISGEAGRNYDRSALRLQEQPFQLAQVCFQFLETQYNGRLVLLFDNLEAVQDDQTYQINDPQARAWLEAACQDERNLVTLATSRWKLPDWNGERLALEGMNKGDFLRLAQALAERGRFNPLLLTERERLNQAYETLGHNPRGLEWLAAATLTMNPQEEQAFAAKLAETRAELRQNMAIEETLARLGGPAYALLRRLHVYAAPVPAEGIVKLGLLSGGALTEIAQPEAAFERLLAFSLLESVENPAYETLEYQIEPSVLDFLREKGALDEDPLLRSAAADYLLWLMEHERPTYPHLTLVIEALRRAGRHPQADRLTLDLLVGKYTLDGRYAELLTRWLPVARQAADPQTRAEAIGQTGKLLIHIGDYANALDYLKSSLQIFQQIGDKAGEGTTLNNISQIYDAQGDYQTALAYLKSSLQIFQQIGDKAGEGTTLNNISQIYDAQGDYQTALAYLKQSLDIRQQIGDKAGEGTTLNNISQIFKAQGDYQTALAYLKQSLDICRQIGDKAGEGTTLNNISALYHAQGDYATALAYLKQSLDICRQIGDKAGEGATLNNISALYHVQGDYATALAYLKQSLTIRQQIGDKAGLCVTLFNMGHIYMQNEQVQEAVRAWVIAYVIAKQINEYQVLQALARLAPQLGLPEGLEGWERLVQQTNSGANT